MAGVFAGGAYAIVAIITGLTLNIGVIKRNRGPTGHRMTGATIDKRGYMIGRFACGDDIIVAIHTRAGYFVVVYEIRGHPPVNIMAGFTQVGCWHVIDGFSGRGDIVMAGHAALVANQGVIHGGCGGGGFKTKSGMANLA